MEQPQQAFSPATKRERFAWCLYDFANSGYTTVILTAIFNAYFVGVVAAEKGEGEMAKGRCFGPWPWRLPMRWY